MTTFSWHLREREDVRGQTGRVGPYKPGHTLVGPESGSLPGDPPVTRCPPASADLEMPLNPPVCLVRSKAWPLGWFRICCFVCSFIFHGRSRAKVIGEMFQYTGKKGERKERERTYLGGLTPEAKGWPPYTFPSVGTRCGVSGMRLWSQCVRSISRPGFMESHGNTGIYNG